MQTKSLHARVCLLVAVCVCSLIASLSASVNAASSGKKLVVFFTQPNVNQDYKPLISQLKTAGTFSGVETINVSEMDKYQVALLTPQKEACIVSLDKQAALLALAGRKQFPYILLGLNRLPLERLHRIYNRLGIKVSGLHTSARPEQQMALARALFADAQAIGMIFDQFNQIYRSEYQNAATLQAFSFMPLFGKAHEYPSRMFSLFPTKPDAIVLSPQNAAQQEKLQAMVVTAFRAGIPLVGGNAQQVNAGALAGFDIGPKQTAQQAFAMIQSSCQSQREGKLAWPTRKKIIINQQIARNLHYAQTSEEQLQLAVAKLLEKYK